MKEKQQKESKEDKDTASSLTCLPWRIKEEEEQEHEKIEP